MYLSQAMKPIVVGKLFGRLYKTGPFEWPPALWDGRINELCASYTFSNCSRTTRSGKGQMKLQKKRRNSHSSDTFWKMYCVKKKSSVSEWDSVLLTAPLKVLKEEAALQCDVCLPRNNWFKSWFHFFSGIT